ncbi:AbrB family transcriptional regulator, partial [Sinorhizobium meliloti]
MAQFFALHLELGRPILLPTVRCIQCAGSRAARRRMTLKPEQPSTPMLPKNGGLGRLSAVWQW